MVEGLSSQDNPIVNLKVFAVSISVSENVTQRTVDLESLCVSYNTIKRIII